MSDSSTPANGSVGDGARTKGFRFGTGMFLLGATLSLGGIAASQAIAKALVAMRHESSIRVKGYAEEAIESDQGTWTGRVQVTAKTLPEAYKKLEEHMATFAAFVVRSGFPDTSLTISAVESQPVYRRDERGNPTNVIEHYQLAQSITVTGHEPKLIERVSRDATSLIKEGIDLASLQPIFVNTQIESIKMRLLAAATDNGRQRAETLAKGAGGQVKGLVSASQGVFQIVKRDSTDVNDYGTYDTGTISKTVKAVVTLEFALDR